MNNFVFYAYDCTEDELKEFIKTAKIIANVVHHNVTIFTATEIFEVREDEEEKEKDVEKPKESKEKPPSREQGS